MAADSTRIVLTVRPEQKALFVTEAKRYQTSLQGWILFACMRSLSASSLKPDAGLQPKDKTTGGPGEDENDTEASAQIAGEPPSGPVVVKDSPRKRLTKANRQPLPAQVLEPAAG